ncbi:MAG: protease complex subunit PrcB family protein [Trueperaceae bacterium]
MFVILLLTLTACLPQTGGQQLHELEIYSNARDLQGFYRYFYGEPTTLKVGSDTLELSEGNPTGDLSVPTALLVNEQPYYKRPLRSPAFSPTRVLRIPLTSDVQLEVGEQVREVLYFDGAKWFTLVNAAGRGFKSRVVPKERLQGLQTVANLTREEAESIQKALIPRAPVAVTVMDSKLPQGSANGFTEYLRSTFYIQQTVPTDESAYQSPNEELIWDVLAEGAQATGVEQAQYVLITNDDQLLEFWNQAHGAQINVPSVPDVDFFRETIVAAFMGTKPTGGYGLNVDRVTLEGSDAYINLTELQPAADAITTQALTSPWVMLKILRGNVNAAWFRNSQDGSLFGVAQRIE